MFCFIRNVKVDLVKYPHPIIDGVLETENVRMYNVSDIAAMKIQALYGRGQKKDFWDVAELLKVFSVEDLIELHAKKYPSQQLLISIPQAMTYFDDAEDTEEPVSLKSQTWMSVKEIIQQKVSDYLR